MENIVSFLFIMPRELTEALYATSLFRRLKAEVENCLVEVLVREEISWVVEDNPSVDQIHTYTQRKEVPIDLFKDIVFDYIVDLQNDFFSWRIKRKLRVLDFSVKNKFWPRTWFRDPEPVSVFSKQADTLKWFDISLDDPYPEIFIKPRPGVFSEDVKKQYPNGYVLLSIEAHYPTQLWDEAKLLEFVKEINVPIVVLGSSGQEALIRKLYEQRRDLITCSSLSVAETIKLIVESKYVICLDSWILPISISYKKSISCLYGSSIPNWDKHRIIGASVTVWEQEGLSCRPCATRRARTCPKEHFRCMTQHRYDLLREQVQIQFTANHS